MKKICGMYMYTEQILGTIATIAGLTIDVLWASQALDELQLRLKSLLVTASYVSVCVASASSLIVNSKGTSFAHVSFCTSVCLELAHTGVEVSIISAERRLF